MKKVMAVLGTMGLLAVLVGCGPKGPVPISHGMSPAKVKNEVLARIHDWHAIEENITEVAYRTQKTRAVFQVRLLSQLSPARFRIAVTPQKSPSYQVINDGLNTIVYQAGAKHYSVLTAEPPSWTEFRVLGTDLPAILQKSRALAVTVKPHEVVLRMVSPVATGLTAKTTLWFNLRNNTPLRWDAVWRGGSIMETPSHMVINPAISSSAFSFTPPSGVKPEVALTAQGTELDLARSQVPFPIILPPAASPLVLNTVNVGTRHGLRVVLLSYQTESGQPVVITESKATTFKAPSGMAMVTETVGLLSVQLGALPNGGEMAAFTENKTLVVVEGPTSEVDSLVNAWGSSTSPSSS